MPSVKIVVINSKTKSNNNLDFFLKINNMQFVAIEGFVVLSDLLFKIVSESPDHLIINEDVFTTTQLVSFYHLIKPYKISIFLVNKGPDSDSKIEALDVKIIRPPFTEDVFLIALLQKQNTDNNFINSPKLNQAISKGYIGISGVSKIDVIAIADILYFEASGRYSLIHLKNGIQFTSSKNIGSYTKRLNDPLFYRIHHKYYVNLKNVAFFNWTGAFSCVLVNKQELPVSQRKKAGVVSFLSTNYSEIENM